MSYNNDINRLRRFYAPSYDRISQAELHAHKSENFDSLKYEAEIDEKIREFKKYEETPNIRIYKSNPKKE